MNGKKIKAARQTTAATPTSAKKHRPTTRPIQGRMPASRRASRSFWKSPGGIVIGLGVVVILALSFVLPGLLKTNSNPATMVGANALGAGLRVGAPVPAFSGVDLLSQQPITSKSLYGTKTLLFFSEGVSCQACLQQIQGIQQMGSRMRELGIRLVSLTPDSPALLDQAIRDYGITTSVISDSNLSISGAFNTLGLGMHSNTPGHAFVLIDKGKVLWYRDYWLAPYQEMYVQPTTLLSDLSHA
jgi:peroxiredoxin